MERERLVRFVQQDYSRVVAAVGFACGDRSVAEDAVQDVLAAALDDDRSVDNLRAWVATAALNRVRSRHRRLGAERRAHDRLGALRPPANPGETDISDELLAAIRSLPARQREITALHYLLDMSVADIAASLRISDGTVKTQLHRARGALRAAFSQPSGEVEVVEVDDGSR